MPPWALAAALTVILILAGCTAARGPTVGSRPADWNHGTELVGYASRYSHKDLYTVDIQSNRTAPIDRPAGCQAFRDAIRYRNDACSIQGTPSPWHAEAVWSGIANGSSLGEPGFNVVAFDGAGRSIAWWHGTFTKDAGRYTE